MAEILDVFVMGVGVGVDEKLRTENRKNTVMISLLVQGLVKLADFGSGKRNHTFIHLHFSIIFGHRQTFRDGC